MTVTTESARVTHESDIELFGTDSLLDPYEDYRKLRDIGPVVRLTRYGCWVAGRYDTVKSILGDPVTFATDDGPGLEHSPINDAWAGAVPAASGADHQAQRRVMLGSIGPKSAATYKERIEEVAARIVDDLLEQREFDAVTEMAEVMPSTAIVEALGLDIERELGVKILHWATDAYQCMGPEGTYEESRPSIEKLYGFAVDELMVPAKLRPGSVGAQAWEAAERGQITPMQAVFILSAYLTAGLDTTSNAISGLMLQFSQDENLWSRIHADPSRVPSAVLEGMRLESPVQWFARRVTSDVEFDGVVVPAGARIMHNYGSANRDERHYPEADRFDLDRNPTDMVTFGHGIHSCVGRHLSQIEVNALVGELARRVKRIEPTGEPVRHVNNVIRGLESLPVRVTPR